tara:strand:+ start:294 stop:707 length:414 start_codon:yes stop_codon:yes gene_type:complete
MKSLFIITTLLLLSNNVIADWEHISTIKDKKIIFYADPTTIKKSDNNIKIWIMADLQEPKEIPYVIKMVFSYKNLVEYNCVQNLERLIRTIGYSKNMAEGDIIYSINESAKWKPIVYDSYSSSIFNYTCKRRKQLLQ